MSIPSCCQSVSPFILSPLCPKPLLLSRYLSYPVLRVLAQHVADAHGWTFRYMCTSIFTTPAPRADPRPPRTTYPSNPPSLCTLTLTLLNDVNIPTCARLLPMPPLRTNLYPHAPTRTPLPARTHGLLRLGTPWTRTCLHTHVSTYRRFRSSFRSICTPALRRFTASSTPSDFRIQPAVSPLTPPLFIRIASPALWSQTCYPTFVPP